MDIAIYKDLISQIMKNYLGQVTTLIEPTVSDAQIIDSFTEDSAGHPNPEEETCGKLGLKSKSTLAGKIDLRGEIVKERDESKIYEKLVHEGHCQEISSTEAELTTLLEEAETATPKSHESEPSLSVKTTAAPAGIFPFETAETLLPCNPDEESDDSPGQQASQDSESEEEDNETAEAVQEETLPAKAFYSRRDTFV